MSLQLIAKQMEAKGRKGDSMLVHMTPGEVAGLQKLAESAGGSLSVNPETGLVEANFLKRMLPTLVGLGVGAATMNPFAGAAAGAAVGGYQARRNDQDVLLGAAMGGLGGYGGASMGAGLTAAGAPTVANVAAPAATVPSSVGTSIMNPATMGTTAGPGITLQGVAPAATTGVTAAPLTASQGLSQAGQGISALGTDPLARGAFMSKVGGGAGLVSDIGMATAPMMAPGKMETEEMPKEDDEMILYDYNLNRTGAELNPSATSAERRYFDGQYSPARRIRARDYPYAEGGEVADAGIAGGMSGASKAAFDYLMGNAASSAPQGIASLRAAPQDTVLSAASNQEYIFNPATGAFSKNPNYVDPAAVAAAAKRDPFDFLRSSFGGSGSDDGSRDGTPMTQAQIDFFDNETPAERDARMEKVGKVLGAVVPGAMAFNFLKDVFTPAPQAPAPVVDRSNSMAVGSDGSPASGYGRDSWSGNMSDYAGSGIDRGDRGEAAGGLITLADGGLMGLAKGGMKSGGFVVPADVVSMVGEGNTDAGYTRIKSMIPGATAIKGKDGGQADTVKTSIEGKQPARVAHGEMYIPPETVKRMGGAKKLYAMMDRVRQQATGSKKQIKPVNLRRAMA